MQFKLVSIAAFAAFISTGLGAPIPMDIYQQMQQKRTVEASQ